MAWLVGLALALCAPRVHSLPEDPAPPGFAWEDLKDIRGRMLRPENSFFRRVVTGTGWRYDLAKQAFEGEGEAKKGLTLEVFTKTKDQLGKPADEYAAASLAELGCTEKVLKGWTRKGEPPGPFTTYGLVLLAKEDGESVTYMGKIVCVANHETDTLYVFMLVSPRAEWKDVEQWGDTVIANLRLDAKF